MRGVGGSCGVPRRSTAALASPGPVWPGGGQRPTPSPQAATLAAAERGQCAARLPTLCADVAVLKTTCVWRAWAWPAGSSCGLAGSGTPSRGRASRIRQHGVANRLRANYGCRLEAAACRATPHAPVCAGLLVAGRPACRAVVPQCRPHPIDAHGASEPRSHVWAVQLCVPLRTVHADLSVSGVAGGVGTGWGGASCAAPV